MMHDIGISALWANKVQDLLKRVQADGRQMRYVQFEGVNFANELGTGFFYEGFDPDTSTLLASFGHDAPYYVGKVRMGPELPAARGQEVYDAEKTLLKGNLPVGYRSSLRRGS
jgi:hypothetical protein